MNPVIIYHADCVDGFTAAWAFWRMFGHDAEYVPAHYGDEPPDVRGKDVRIVDFSYPRELLMSMCDGWRAANTIRVLDHHKTAAENLRGLEFAEFDMDRSGASMAWDYLNPHTARPVLVNYVEDRDLWRWALPRSKEVSAYIRTVPRVFPLWDALAAELDEHLDKAANKGAIALRVVEQYVEGKLKSEGRAMIGGHDVRCVNTTFAVSETVGELAKNEPFAAGWFQKDTGEFVYSLRSRDGGLDVSEIAEEYGGGGHARAAGFTSDCLLRKVW